LFKTDEATKLRMIDNEKKMKEMEKSYEEKLKAAKAEAAKSHTINGDNRSELLEKAKKIPHLSNINMDPALTGTIKYLLEGEGQKKIGFVGCDILMKGVG
jgi:kinesin family member 1